MTTTEKKTPTTKLKSAPTRTKKLSAAPKAPVKKKVKEPFVSIVCNTIDPELGLLIDFNWSDEFVAYLRTQGYIGVSDERIVRQWLATQYFDMSERLRDAGTEISDYE